MSSQSGGVRLPPHLQPRLKAAATASSSDSLDGLRRAAGSSSSLEGLRAPTPPRPHSRRRSRSPRSSSSARHGRSSSAVGVPAPESGADVEADDATAAFVRRVLCPYADTRLHGGESQSVSELLPPLTSSNAVDLQLYGILAVVVREFVYSWYGKITPDQTFVEEVIRIVAHCTRDLEQRLRRVDLTAVLLDEIPELMRGHVAAYRAAIDPQRPSALAADPRAVYHALDPHPAFSPVPQDPASIEVQAANERHYRQLLVHGALAVLLPTEDLQSPPLRILVADVLGEMILGRGIGQKACEGWLIWDGVAKAVASVQRILVPKATGAKIEVGTRSRLERFGLLAEQGSAAARAVKAKHRRTSFAEWFWRLLQYGYLTYVTLRFLVTGLFVAASSPPLRLRTKGLLRDAAAPAPRPMLALAAFDCTSTLLDLSHRMPWTLGTLALLRWHLTQPEGWLRGLGATDGTLDKFLYHLTTTHLLSPTRVTPALRQLRVTLFPNNVLGPARQVPPLDEQRAIRRRAAEALLELVPRAVARRLFVTRPADHGNERIDGKATDPKDPYFANTPSADTKDRPSTDTRAPRATSTREPSISPSSSASRRSSPSPAPVRVSARTPTAPTATSPLAASMTADDLDAADDQSTDLDRDSNEGPGGARDRRGDDDAENEAIVHDVERILDVFGDAYMNKHLIFGVVELLFVRLLPELGESGVRELLEERGIAV